MKKFDLNSQFLPIKSSNENKIRDISSILASMDRQSSVVNERKRNFIRGVKENEEIQNSWFTDVEICNEINLFNSIIKTDKSKIFPLRYYDMVGKRSNGITPDKTPVLNIQNSISGGENVIFPYLHKGKNGLHWVFCEAKKNENGKINLTVHNGSHDAKNTEFEIKKDVAKNILGKMDYEVDLLASDLKTARQADKNMCGGIVLREMFEKALEISDKQRSYNTEQEAVKCASPLFSIFERAKELGTKVEIKTTADNLLNIISHKKKEYLENGEKRFENKPVLKNLISKYCEKVETFIMSVVVFIKNLFEKDSNKQNPYSKKSVNNNTQSSVDGSNNKYAKAELQIRGVNLNKSKFR